MKFNILMFLIPLTSTLRANEIYSFDNYYKNQPGYIFQKNDDIDRKRIYKKRGIIEDEAIIKSQKIKINYDGKNFYLNNNRVIIKNLTNNKLPQLDASILQLYTPVSDNMKSDFFCIDTWALNANSTTQREKYIIFFTNKTKPSAYLIPGYLSSCIAIRHSSGNEITFPKIQIKNEKSNEQSIIIQYKMLNHGQILDTAEEYTGKFIDTDDIYHFYLNNTE